jgi:hypothetical protein
MRGTAVILRPGEPPEFVDLDPPPADLDFVRKLNEWVGGYIEIVPYWQSFIVDRVTHRCVVYCNEDGKRLGLPVNDPANWLWDAALRRDNAPPLIPDALVGTVVVLYGDDEFMESM